MIRLVTLDMKKIQICCSSSNRQYNAAIDDDDDDNDDDGKRENRYLTVAVLSTITWHKVKLI